MTVNLLLSILIITSFRWQLEIVEPTRSKKWVCPATSCISEDREGYVV